VIFRTKREGFFTRVWIVILIIVNALMIVPLWLDPEVGPVEIGVVLGLCVLITGLLLWLMIDIRYTMTDEHLIVKGGPFGSKIKYADITRITDRPSIWAGYRILASRDAIEVHYKTGFMGSVMISPADKERFIAELQKRNPSIRLG
jgi:hypothetical protein